MSVRSRPVDVTEGGTAGPLRQMVVGLREIAHSRAVGLLVALSVLASMVYGMDTVLFVGASEERLGLGPDGFGVLMTGLAVGGLLAAAAVNRLAGSPRLAAVLTLAMMLYCLPNIVLAVTSSPAVAVAAQVARGAGTLIVDVLAMTALQRAVAPDVTARVFGVFWALIVGAIALGALVAPPVVSVLGLESAIVVLALGAGAAQPRRVPGAGADGPGVRRAHGGAGHPRRRAGGDGPVRRRAAAGARAAGGGIERDRGLRRARR